VEEAPQRVQLRAEPHARGAPVAAGVRGLGPETTEDGKRAGAAHDASSIYGRRHRGSRPRPGLHDGAAPARGYRRQHAPDARGGGRRCAMKATTYGAEHAQIEIGEAVASIQAARSSLFDIAKRLGGIGDGRDRTLEQYLASCCEYIAKDKLDEPITSLQADIKETRATHRKRVAEWDADERRVAKSRAKRAK